MQSIIIASSATVAALLAKFYAKCNPVNTTDFVKPVEALAYLAAQMPPDVIFIHDRTPTAVYEIAHVLRTHPLFAHLRATPIIGVNPQFAMMPPRWLLPAVDHVLYSPLKKSDIERVVRAVSIFRSHVRRMQGERYRL